MHKKIAIIIISLFFLGEISVEESEPNFNELEIESFAFVNNPNGIQLYNKAGDFKSKTNIIRYQDEFELYGSYGAEIKGKHWRKVKFQKKDFYILEDEMYLQFENKESDEYALVQEKDLVVYEKPFKDSKIIGKLDQFSIVNPLSLFRVYDSYMGSLEMEGNQNQFNTWYKVKTQKQLTGFILNGIGEPSTTKESIEEEKNKKVLNIKGYCELTTKSQNFYMDEKLNNQLEDRIKKIFQAKQFVSSDYSFEKNKVRYFHIHSFLQTKKTKSELDTDKKRMREGIRSKYNTENFEAYISEKQCKFYTAKEYSDYTATNSQFKGDKNAIYTMKKIFDQNNLYLDYTHFKLIPLNPKSSKFDSYFFAALPRKKKNNFKNYERAILLRKTKTDYEVASNSLYPYLELIDIDKDGILELFVHAPMRADMSENELFIFLKGKYVSINTVLPKNEQLNYFQDNEICVDKTIYDKDGQYQTTEQIRYKYYKGKLIKIK